MRKDGRERDVEGRGLGGRVERREGERGGRLEGEVVRERGWET